MDKFKKIKMNFDNKIEFCMNLYETPVKSQLHVIIQKRDFT